MVLRSRSEAVSIQVMLYTRPVVLRNGHLRAEQVIESVSNVEDGLRRRLPLWERRRAVLHERVPAGSHKWLRWE